MVRAATRRTSAPFHLGLFALSAFALACGSTAAPTPTAKPQHVELASPAPAPELAATPAAEPPTPVAELEAPVAERAAREALAPAQAGSIDDLLQGALSASPSPKSKGEGTIGLGTIGTILHGSGSGGMGRVARGQGAMRMSRTANRFGVELSRERYAHIDEPGFLRVQDQPLSTFSVDVDTASYSNLRRMLREGQRPPEDAVRIEEMINYFDYDAAPPSGSDPVAIHTEVSARQGRS